MKELQLIYNSAKNTDKQVFALLKSLKHYVVNELDIQHNTMTPRRLAELAESLNVEISDLINQDSAEFRQKFNALSHDEQLSRIQQDIELLKTPIIQKDQNEARFVESPETLYSMDLEIKASDKFA